MDNQSERLSLKIIVVGDSASGKTTIINAHKKEQFRPTNVTAGVDYKIHQITIRDQKYYVNIWDTAGQERYANIVTLSCKDTDAALICFDLSQAYSSQSIRKWMKVIQDNCPEQVYIALIGTKSDLPQVYLQDALLNLQKELKTEFHKDLPLCYTSGKTGMGVEDAFHLVYTNAVDIKFNNKRVRTAVIIDTIIRVSQLEVLRSVVINLHIQQRPQIRTTRAVADIFNIIYIMILELTEDQYQIIRHKLPERYTLSKVRAETKKVDFSVSGVDEQNKCIQIVKKLREQEPYKLLTHAGSKTYCSRFDKEIKELQEKYYTSGSDELRELVLGQFWRDFTQIIHTNMIFSSADAYAQLVELEKFFYKQFQQHQMICLPQSNELMMNLINSPPRVITPQRKARATLPTDQEKEELLQKLKKLPVHNQKYLLDYLKVKADKFDLNLNDLDMYQYRRIENFTKKRFNDLKRQKANKKFQKLHPKPEYSENSYQSFLSDSQELIL